MAHLEKPSSDVRILVFDFSSGTIQPVLLRDKVEKAGVDFDLVEWILDYLTNWQQFVKAWDCVSDFLTYSVGVPQGTVIAPFLFTLYTADFRHSMDIRALQALTPEEIAAFWSEGGISKDFSVTLSWHQRSCMVWPAGVAASQ